MTGGDAALDGESLLDLDAEEAAKKGVFLAFQYPVELPGVSNIDFLRLMVNENRKAAGDDELEVEAIEDERSLEAIEALHKRMRD